MPKVDDDGLQSGGPKERYAHDKETCTPHVSFEAIWWIKEASEVRSAAAA